MRVSEQCPVCLGSFFLACLLGSFFLAGWAETLSRGRRSNACLPARLAASQGLSEKGIEAARHELSGLREQCRQQVQRVVHENHVPFLQASDGGHLSLLIP